MFKRIGLLGVITIIFILSFNVCYASDTVTRVVWNDPLFNDIDTAEVEYLDNSSRSFKTDAAESTSFKSWNSLILYVREHLKTRDKVISVSLIVDVSKINQYSCNRLLNDMLEHTGEPDEGDYIRANTINFSIKTSGSIAGGKAILDYTLTTKYYETASQAAWVDEKVDSLMNSFNANEAFSNGNDYEKLYIMYRYITENMTYDFDRVAQIPEDISCHGTYNALKYNTAVCQAFASLMYRLALSADIDTRIIISSNHAWNMSRVNSQYYYLDPTWDLGFEDSFFFLIGTDRMSQLDQDNAHVPSEAIDFLNQYNLRSTNAVNCKNHTYGDWALYKSPTCKEAGIDEHFCTNCGNRETRDISTIPHKYSVPGFTWNGESCTFEMKCSSCTAHDDIACNVEKTITRADMKNNGNILYTASCTYGDVKYKDTKKVAIPAASSIALSKTSYIYTGKNIKPSVYVKTKDGKALAVNKDYTATMSKSTACGKYCVSIKGIGNYTFNVKKYYTIIPKKSVVSKATAGSRSVKVKLSAKPSGIGAKAYQIAYRVKGTSSWKYITTTSQTTAIKSLKKGKKYQIKARGYVTSGSKYYGAWSSIKTTAIVK